ncbi:MAG: hypothetical protein MJ252_05735 [archaeon]|nr:hypothetical protein [archaeon]
MKDSPSRQEENKPDLSLPISKWNTNEVAEFLTEIGLENLSKNFFNLNINGYDLCKFTDEDYKQIDVTNQHELNLLKKYIQIKLIEELKLNISCSNKNYNIQINLLKDMTVDKVSQILSKILGNNNFKPDIILCTKDNQILCPEMNIAELLLIDPETYQNLKVFNEGGLSSYSINNTNTNNNVNNITSATNDILNNRRENTLMNKYKTLPEMETKNSNENNSNAFSNHSDLQYKERTPSGGIKSNYSNGPTTNTGLNSNILGKRLEEQENKEGKLREIMENNLNNPIGKTQRDLGGLPKYSFEYNGPTKTGPSTPNATKPPTSYFPFKNGSIGANMASGLNEQSNPTEIGNNLDSFDIKKGLGDYESKPIGAKFDYKVDYKKYSPGEPSTSGISSMNKTTPTPEMKYEPSKYEKYDNSLESMKMRMMLDKNNTMGKPPIPRKERENYADLSNDNSGYVFNSGELYSNFDQLKANKTENKFGSDLKIGEYNPITTATSSGNQTQQFNFRMQNPSTQQPSTHKEDYRRVSSEKRTYRTSNTFNPTNTSTNIEDYKPKQYQKYSPNQPEEDSGNTGNNRMNEGYMRYSARPENENKTGNYGLGQFSSLRAKIGGFGGEGMKKGSQFETGGDTLGSIGTINSEFKGFGKYGIKGGDSSLNVDDKE